MRTMLLVSAILLSMICPELAAAQALDAKNVKYDWRSESFFELDRVSPGDLVRLEIANTNAFCYDYVVTLEQVVVEETSIDPTALFTTGVLAPDIPDPSKSAEEVTATNVAQGLQIPTQSPEDKAFLELTTAMSSLRIDLNDAIKTAKNISKLEKAASKASDDFYAHACPTEGRGKTITEKDQKLKDATVSIEALVKALDGLPALVAAAAAITKGLARLEVQADDFATKYPNYPQQVLIPDAIKGLKADSDQLTATVTTLGKLSKKDLAEGVALIRTATDNAPIVRTIPVRSNTGTIRVSIAATGKESISTVTKRKLEDSFEILVDRRHRVFLSVGFIWSTLDSRHYERVNRQEAAGDSTFSTYAAVDSSSSTGFAPAILVNVSLWSFGDFALYASGGVAARSVNNTLTPPDYLLGVSVGVIDRILLTLTAQRGRVEVLLLGNEATVSKSPVPAAITRESAVGTTSRWAFALAFTVSI